MRHPLCLLLLLGAATIAVAQKPDTLCIFYKTDQFTLSKNDQQLLDSFTQKKWDHIVINGYTDNEDDAEYNMELSAKRSGVIYDYLVTKKFPGSGISSRYFGEMQPKGNNDSEEGRAQNRRAEVIGYRYIKVQPKPVQDLMKPVTQTLNNGFIVTYRPGALPQDMADNFANGWGMDFELITNTAGMRQNNLFNNTTNGEILSSVMIFSYKGPGDCAVDSPVLVKVPIPSQRKCPVEKIKFFNAVVENGKRIWQEQNKVLFPEMINGQQYLSVWLNSLCETINFDFKIDPDCFDMDSTQVYYVNGTVKNLSAELVGLNSVYIPRKIGDTLNSLLFEKNAIDRSLVSFSLYNGKKRVRTYYNQHLNSLPYDPERNAYMLTTGETKLSFRKVKVIDVVLKVNKEKYRVAPDETDYHFLYLRRREENTRVDIIVEESRRKTGFYNDVPLSSLPFDAATGQYVIDRDFIKELKIKRSIVRTSATH